MSDLLKISQETLTASLEKYNPWWKSLSSVLKFTKKRDYFNSFKDLVLNNNIRRTVILMGPRRVGKTVMLYQLVHYAIQEKKFTSRNVLFISIDDPIYNNVSLEELVLSFHKKQNHKTQTKKLIIFDEIQYLKNWERHLKVLTDQYPHIQFVASGSSAAALKRQSMESGAGRFTDFFLPALTFKEFINLSGKSHFKNDIKKLNQEFINYINFGGYPEPVFNKAIQTNIKRFIANDVINKVLLRDLPNLYGIQDIQELNSLFTMVAFNSSREINLESLSKNSNIAKNTIHKYLTYLESAFLIKRIYRIDDSGKRFKRARHFKVYLTNPSMYSALFGQVQEKDTIFGNIVETAVFSQLFHREHSSGKRYYAKWKKNQQEFEVDLVQTDNRYKPQMILEIKWSDSHYQHINKLKGALNFALKHNLGKIVTTSKTKSDRTQHLYRHKNLNIVFIPCSSFCYKFGTIMFEKQEE